MLKRSILLVLSCALVASGCNNDKLHGFMIDTIVKCRQQRLEVESFEITSAHNKLILKDDKLSVGMNKLSVGMKSCIDAILDPKCSKADAEKTCSQAISSLTGARKELMSIIDRLRQKRFEVDTFDYDPAGKMLSLTNAGHLIQKKK